MRTATSFHHLAVTFLATFHVAVVALSYEPTVVWQNMVGVASARILPLTTGWVLLSNKTLPTPDDSWTARRYLSSLETESRQQAISFRIPFDSLYLRGTYMPAAGTVYNRYDADIGLIVDGETQPTTALNFTFVPDDAARYENGSVYDIAAYANGTPPYLGVFIQYDSRQRATWHNLTLTTGPSFQGKLVITDVSWFSQMMTAHNLSNTDSFRGDGPNRLHFVDGDSLEKRYTFTGNASVYTSSSYAGEGSLPLPPGERALALMGASSVSVTLPPNSSWVSIDGLVGPDCGVFNIALDPSPPEGPDSLSLPTSKPFQTTDTFFAVPLDPSIGYRLTLSTQSSTVGRGVYLNSTMVIPYNDTYAECLAVLCRAKLTIRVAPDWSDGQDRSKQSSGKAALIGGVVAGVVASMVVAGALWYFCLRGRVIILPTKGSRAATDRRVAGSNDHFEVDEETHIIDSYDRLRPLDPATDIEAAATDQTQHRRRLGVERRDAPTASALRPHEKREVVQREEPSLLEATKARFAAPRSMPSRSPPTPRSPPVQVEVVQEVDSGALVRREFVPPQYNPEWGENWSTQRQRPD